jgi:hypothetical protein
VPLSELSGTPRLLLDVMRAVVGCAQFIYRSVSVLSKYILLPLSSRCACCSVAHCLSLMHMSSIDWFDSILVPCNPILYLRESPGMSHAAVRGWGWGYEGTQSCWPWQLHCQGLPRLQVTHLVTHTQKITRSHTLACISSFLRQTEPKTYPRVASILGCKPCAL